MKTLIEVQAMTGRVLEFEPLPNNYRFFCGNSPKAVNKLESDSEKKSSLSSISPTAGKQGWEASEHKYIGTTTFMQFCQGIKLQTGKPLLAHFEEAELFDIGGKKIQLRNFKIERKNSEGKITEETINIDFTPGDIVALAGDFSGIIDKPICFGKDPHEQCSRFMEAYLSLAAPKDPNKYKKLISQINAEYKTISEQLAKGLKPSFALEKAANKSNRKYGAIMQYTYLPWTYLYSEYVDLAAMNFDHFREQAEAAYRAGHETAIATAKEAHRLISTNEPKSWQLLVLAFTQELYACHFLTDLFSAGHMRTLRKELWDYTKETSYVPGQYGKRGIAGLLAQVMHDEDNHYGLEVKRAVDGKVWKAYGDKCYFNPENQMDNSKVVIETVKVALSEIYEAFTKGVVNSQIYNYIPKPTENNFAPLFRLSKDKKTIQYRKDVVNLSKKEAECDYTDLTDFVGTYRWLLTRPGAENTISPDEQRKLEMELAEFVKEDDKQNHLRCTLL